MGFAAARAALPMSRGSRVIYSSLLTRLKKPQSLQMQETLRYVYSIRRSPAEFRCVPAGPFANSRLGNPWAGPRP